MKPTEFIKESQQVEEVKSGEIKNHPWICRRAKIKGTGEVGEVIRVCREHTFSQMVPFVTMVWIKLDSGETKEVRQNHVQVAKKQGVEEAGGRIVYDNHGKPREISPQEEMSHINANLGRMNKKASPFSDGGEDEYGNHQKHAKDEYGNVFNESDGGGTCSASIAAGPAQNLFTEPQKRNKAPKASAAKKAPKAKINSSISYEDATGERFALAEGDQLNEYIPKVIPKTLAGGKLNPNHPSNKDAIAAQKAAHADRKAAAASERRQKAARAQEQKRRQAEKEKAYKAGQKAKKSLGPDTPTTPLEKKAQDAMWQVWNAIAPDMMQAIKGGGYDDDEDLLEDPYWVAEVCCDANHMQTFAHLSREEEREILDTLDSKTLARLASNFGY